MPLAPNPPPKIKIDENAVRPVSTLWSLMLLPLLVALAHGCTPPPAFNPCLEVTCAGHGRCKLIGGHDGHPLEPTCLCDEGFAPSPSGWLCLSPEDTSLCAGVGCSGHGRCVSFRGAPRCVCDTAYRLDASGLHCDDPCDTISCGLGGICSTKDGSPTCTCPPGTRPSLDGKRCEADGGPYAVYAFTLDNLPDRPMGHATLDFSTARGNAILEIMSFGFPIDYSRGVARTTRQVWKLDDAGDFPLEATIDDLLKQGNVTHRRRVMFSMRRHTGRSGYTYDALLQRQDKLTNVTGDTQEMAPLPMVGAFEYPGWTLGCFSPSFYMFLKRRYDFTQGGVQAIEIFQPSTGIVTTIDVRVDTATSTPSATVLELIDEQTLVTYDGDLPMTIHFVSNQWTWTRIPQGAPADANLAPPPAATPTPPTLLPAASHVPETITTHDGLHLAATLTTPQDAQGKLPALLLLGGPFALDRDHPHRALPRSPLAAHLAAHLAAAGYASLRFDPRGRGQSQGDADTATLAQLQSDALAAFNALVTHPKVDAAHVYVLSFGWGSTTAIPIGAAPSPPRAYIGLAPIIAETADAFVYTRTEHLVASGFSKSFLDRQRKSARDRLTKIAEGSSQATRYAGLSPSLVKELLAYDARPILNTFLGPVLLLRGDQDLEIDPAQLALAAQAVMAAGKTNVEIETLKGLTFHFSSGKRSDLWESSILPLVIDPALISRLTTWLAAH